MDFSELVGVIGIYAIRIQDYIYIGQASNMYMRWSNHTSMLRRNKHENNFMQNVYNKYGEIALSFFIIDETLGSDLTPSEQWYLDTLKMFYPNGKILNIAPAAGSCLGIKRSDETRAKLSAAHLGKTNRAKTHNIILLAPDGAQHGPIHNLDAFSREHGLNRGNMHNVITGKAKSCKGWRLFVGIVQ